MGYRYQARVRYGECDQQGVVFNANYMVYMDDATEQWISSKAPDGKFTSLDWDWMVVRSVLEWRGSAHFGETLEIEVGVVRYGSTSFDVGYVGSVKGETVFTARAVCVSCEAVTLKKCPIPERIKARLGEAVTMDVPS
jgi:acyl-CoA thioester hydrolase